MYARNRGAECTPSWNSARASITGPAGDPGRQKHVEHHHVVQLGVGCCATSDPHRHPVADDASAGPVERTGDGVVVQALQRCAKPRPVAAALPSIGEAEVPELANGWGEQHPPIVGPLLQGQHDTGGHQEPQIERCTPAAGHDGTPPSIGELEERDTWAIRSAEQRQLSELRQVVPAIDEAAEGQPRRLPRWMLLHPDPGKDRVRPLHRPHPWGLRSVLGRFHPTLIARARVRGGAPEGGAGRRPAGRPGRRRARSSRQGPPGADRLPRGERMRRRRVRLDRGPGAGGRAALPGP